MGFQIEKTDFVTGKLETGFVPVCAGGPKVRWPKSGGLFFSKVHTFVNYLKASA